MNKMSVGEVVSTTEKTISVRVKSFYVHPIYHKQLLRFKNYLTHDEKNIAKVGDIVRIQACRPISKRKKWKIESVVTQVVSE